MELHIKDAIEGLSEWFKQRTCQLFLLQANGKVQAEGSGTLIEINYNKILVTAGHVIANGSYNHLCFPNLRTQGMTSISGIWYPSDKNENVGLDTDDFAYLKIQEDTVRKLEDEGYKFINEDNIDNHHLPSETSIYSCVGCRWRHTEKKGIDHYSKLQIISNFGAPKHIYQKELNNSNLIIVQINKKMVSAENMNIEVLGRLEGMSGGAVWYCDLEHDYNIINPTIKLVGILIAYNTNSIFSCNINRIIHKLYERNHL